MVAKTRDNHFSDEILRTQANQSSVPTAVDAPDFRFQMSDSSQRLDFLRATYTQSLASKYSALESAWHEFAAAPDAVPLRDLHVLAHRLAGSASGYGYEQIGEFARTVDTHLSEWEDLPGSLRGSGTMLAQKLARPMRELLDALVNAASSAAGPPPAS